MPANTPIALQPLDAENKALQLMCSWFTAMPGKAVSCLGCHEDAKDRPPAQRPNVDNRHQVSAVVGSYQPNAWGLQDLHGNVWEWTRSACLPYPFRADDPRHAAAGGRRVVRGGSWFSRAGLARSGSRASYWPWQRVFDGFRVVCEPEP